MGSDDVGDQISPAGLAALELELHRLETDGRRDMAERLRTARAWGDLKENSEYHDAKDAQAHLETRILRLRARRANAIVVEPGAGGGRVSLGTVVVVRDADSGRETTHTLASATESDPASGRLSATPRSGVRWPVGGWAMRSSSTPARRAADADRDVEPG